jgi:hypothetical protein
MISAMPNPTHVRKPADQVRIADEIARVCDLRAQGLSLRAIAAEMGFDVKVAHERWHEGLTNRTRPNVDAAIEAELARLDHLDERLLDALGSLDLNIRIRGVDSARRNSESRRKLHGSTSRHFASVRSESYRRGDEGKDAMPHKIGRFGSEVLEACRPHLNRVT